ncbi:MAG: S41 family peptidase [Schleiferiaceae bacterium]|nr:S41 family peptidase [Schleiferiaceae bacterium]
MNSEKKSWIPRVANKIALTLVVASAAIFMGASTGDTFETSKQLEVFTGVLREVQLSYVDEISPELAVGSAIKGMLKELDPYSVYYPEDRIEDVRLMQTGEYGGIGCVIQKVDGVVLISDINDKGPAGLAGLRVGDALIQVGNTSLKGKSVSDVSALLKGTPGTEVSMVIERFNQGSQTLMFNRAKIQQDAVPFFGMRDDGIGYIYLESFTDKAGLQVRQAVQELKKESPKGLILDLRGNGGGLLMEAVKIVSYFSDTKDTIVSTRGRGGEIQDVYRKAAKTLMADLPLAVLVDGSSASASEIVAGALQDLDRGVILGEKSFGKGLVQQIRPLPFGAQMKITVAKYYTPSGRCIQKVNYDRDVNGKRTKKSKQHSFSTLNGRNVVDGDGVYPDSTLQSGYYPEFVMAMSSKGLDLKFAGQVIGAIDTDANAVDFVVDDLLWKSFTDFLETAGFDFESLSEMKLTSLNDDASLMDYLEPSDIEALLKVVQERKGKVLEDQRAEISEYLADYLVQKNFSTRGALERGMYKDAVVTDAAKILLNPGTMSALLSVK